MTSCRRRRRYGTGGGDEERGRPLQPRSIAERAWPPPTWSRAHLEDQLLLNTEGAILRSAVRKQPARIHAGRDCAPPPISLVQPGRDGGRRCGVHRRRRTRCFRVSMILWIVEYLQRGGTRTGQDGKRGDLAT